MSDDSYICPHGHRRFLPGEERELAAHLLSGCDRCSEQVSELHLANQASQQASLSPSQSEAGQYSDIVSTSIRSSLKESQKLESVRASAPRLLADLLRFAPERRQIVVCNSRRFHDLGLCELLLKESEAQWFRSGTAARNYAELAVAVAETLEVKGHSPRILADLRGRAWAYLGNALKILTNYQAAERAFKNAEDHLQQGTGSPTEESLLLEFRISLLMRRRLLKEAEQLADKAARTYRQIGDTHLQGRILIRKGLCRGQQDDPEAAIRHLRLGLRLIDQEADPRLVITSKHNLANYLTQTGRMEEATELIQEVRPYFIQWQDFLSLSRLVWIEGQIAKSQNELEIAEALLKEAGEYFIQEEIAYDAAQVGLELAEIYALQGRTRELRTLAEELIPIFESREVYGEALAALAMFQQATLSEAVSLSLIHQVTGYLDQLRKDHMLEQGH